MKKLIIINLILLMCWGCEKDPMPAGIPSVTTDAVTDISNTSATVGVDINDKSSTNEVGVLYSSTAQYPIYGNAQMSHSNSWNIYQGENSFSLTGLLSGTMYYYRAYATDGYGGYVYGDVKTFTTTVSSSIVTTDNAINIKATSFDLYAELTDSYLVSEWGIVFNLTNYSDPTSGRYDKFSTTINGQNGWHYSNCLSNHTYYYCAYAKLKTGRYVYGDIWWVKTSAY